MNQFERLAEQYSYVVKISLDDYSDAWGWLQEYTGLSYEEYFSHASWDWLIGPGIGVVTYYFHSSELATMFRLRFGKDLDAHR